MIISVGIDPSFTGFSWTALGKHYDNLGIVGHERKVTKAKDFPKDAIGRVERYRQLIKSVVKFCNHNPIIILIENYSYRSVGQGMFKGELGGILRDKLTDSTDVIVEVAPKTLKKFVTGSGKATKLQMIRAVEKRYGVEVDNDDDADSYGLAKIGECLLGYDIPQTKAQYETMTVIQKRINEDNPNTFSNIEKIRIDNTLI